MKGQSGKENLSYVWAVVAVAMATGMRWMLGPSFQDSYVFILYVPAVVIAAWTGGIIPAGVGAVLSLIAITFFVGLPLDLALSKPREAAMVIFVLQGAILVAIIERLRHVIDDERNVRPAEQASITSLVDRERRLRSVLDNTWDVGIVMMDRNRIIREWNVGAAQITGYGKTEAIGRSADLLFIDDDKLASEGDHEQLIAEATGKAFFSRKLTRRDGAAFHAEGTLRPTLGEVGEVTGFIKTFADVSGRVALQHESSQMLTDRIKEVETLTYNMAHDMRQYARGISVNAEMIMRDLKDKLDGEDVGALTRLSDNAKRMNSMVEGLLDHLRFNRAPINSKPVDLSKLAEEAAERIGVAGEANHIHFIVQPGLWAKGDADLLSLVLMNLFENATKYGAGHVVFGHDAARQAFCVKDEGPGFDPKFAEKIFKVFERLHGQEKPGTGIGLTNAKRIIERHGGKMWAESEPGKGAAFYFTLKTAVEEPVGALR
jgi:PAS domain S-box-containing protein